jgi:isochorismate synthase EntC
VPRGLYASPVGWVGAGGTGAFAVGIRSALLLPDSALLFAGAGIVRGSVPELEVIETSAKLLTMLAGVSGASGSQRRLQPEDEVIV